MTQLIKERHKHISRQQFSITRSLKSIDTCRSSSIIVILFLSLLFPCAFTMHTDKDELKIKTPFKPKPTSGKTVSFPATKEDFYQVATKCSAFVDKSLMIQMLIDVSLDFKVLLFTRPRRWGKSLNMNMICRFFNKEVDQTGNPLKPQPNRILFEGGELQLKEGGQVKKIHLKKLKIAQVEGNYMKRQGQYPVIYLTLKDTRSSTFQEFHQKIQQEISQLFMKHMYIYNHLISKNQVKCSINAKKFMQIIQMTSKSSTFEKSLRLLSQLLKQFFNEPVLILIDEYDAAFNHMLYREFAEKDPQTRTKMAKERKEVASMLTAILSAALKSNGALFMGILTGLYDIVQKEGDSGLNNISVYGINDFEFSEFYGLSKEQIQQQLLSHMFYSLPQIKEDELLESITKWYNGYRVEGRNYQLYNPFAVINYLEKCCMRAKVVQGESFWTATGSSQLLRFMFSQFYINNIVSKILTLAKAEEDMKEKKPSSAVMLEYDRKRSLGNLMFSTKFRQTDLTYILINSGYITGQTRQIQNRYYLSAVLPNKQIKQLFDSLFRQWINDNISPNMDFLNLENTEILKQRFESICNQSIRNMGERNEAWFNSLFAGAYFFSKDTRHLVSVEVASGDGRVDHIFFPKVNVQQPSETVVIHQYKVAHRSVDQQSLYNEALWQMYERRYMLAAVQASKTQKHIQKILNRAIVIVVNGHTQSVNLYMKSDIIHSVEDAERICDFFAVHKRSKSENFESYSRRILQLKQVQNIEKLLKKICMEEAREELRACDFNYQKAYTRIFGSSRKKLVQQQDKGRVLTNSQDLYHASLGQVSQTLGFMSLQLRQQEKQRELTQQQLQIEALLEQEQSIPRQAYEELQKIKREQEYFKPMSDQHPAEKSQSKQATDRQVYTLLLQPDLLQEAFNRIEMGQKQKVLKSKSTQSTVALQQANSPAKTAVLVDPQTAVDQKLVSQAEYFQQTGIAFESLHTRIIEGAVRIFKEGLFPAIYGSSLKLSESLRINLRAFGQYRENSRRQMHFANLSDSYMN